MFKAVQTKVQLNLQLHLFSEGQAAWPPYRHIPLYVHAQTHTEKWVKINKVFASMPFTYIHLVLSIVVIPLESIMLLREASSAKR